MRFVRIFARVYCIGGDKPEWNAKIGNFSLNIASFRRWRRVRCVAFCIILYVYGFLMTQRQMTLKYECGYWVGLYNVNKLHRLRISDDFLADTVGTTRL